MSNEISVSFKVDDQDIKLTPKIVSEYLTGGSNITMPEFKMFTELCKSRKLNPFLKEAYIIKYGNSPATIVVGKDAILKRAILHPQFDGREQGIIVIDVDGNAVEKNGTFKLSTETLAGAWARVFRKDWAHPVYVSVSFDEVAQRKRDGDLNSQWLTKSATMVEKVALVRALREAFVEDLGGMYDELEMKQDDAPAINDAIDAEFTEQEEPVINEEMGNVVDINNL